MLPRFQRELQSRRKELVDSGEYTDARIAKRMAEHVTKAHQEYSDAYKRQLKSIAEERSRLHQVVARKMQPPESKASPQREALLLQALRELPLKERSEVLSRAAASKDTELLAAVLNNHPIVSGIPSETSPLWTLVRTRSSTASPFPSERASSTSAMPKPRPWRASSGWRK